MDLFQDKNLMSNRLWCAGSPWYVKILWRESKAGFLSIFCIKEPCNRDSVNK